MSVLALGILSYLKTRIIEPNGICKRVYDYKKYKTQLFNNTRWASTMSKLIENLLDDNLNQMSLDHMYDQFIKDIFTELDKYMHFDDIAGSEIKKFKYYKPYWDNDLKHAWHNMRELHKKFKSTGLKSDYNEFIIKRHYFDKLMNKKRRRYMQSKIDDTNKAETKNPCEFWNLVNNLGPKKSRLRHEKVSVNGEIISDPNVVLNTWKSDFDNMYNKPERAKSHCDTQFEKGALEHFNFSSDLYDNSVKWNTALNREISMEEVEMVPIV